MANNNKSHVIALVAMMDGSPEKRSTNIMAQLQREAWMDMPLKAMSKSQREALKEYERQVHEAEDNLRTTQRILEGECKALEDEVAIAIKAFNSHLDKLQLERLQSAVQVAMAEQLRLSSASTLLKVAGFRHAYEVEGISGMC